MHEYLTSCGAFPDDKPRSSTGLLIVGEKPGAAKLKAAKQRNSIVLTERQFWKEWIAPSQRPPLISLWLDELVTWDQARSTGVLLTMKRMLDVGILPSWMQNAYLKNVAKYKMPSVSAKDIVKSIKEKPAPTEFEKFCEEGGIDLGSYTPAQKTAMHNVWGAFKDDPVISADKLAKAVLQVVPEKKAKKSSEDVAFNEMLKVSSMSEKKAKKTAKADGDLSDMDDFVKACSVDGIILDDYDDASVGAMYKIWQSLSDESLSTKAVMKVVKAAAVPKAKMQAAKNIAFDEAVKNSSMPASLKAALLKDPDEPKKPKKDEPTPPKGRLIDV